MKAKNIKRKLISASLALFLFLSVTPVNSIKAYATENSTNVVFNGESRTLASDPVNVSGTLLVSLRDIAEMFGAEVTWNNKLKEATVTKGDTEITVKVGSPTAFVNNRVSKLSQEATIINDKIMVPIRFIGEAFEADIKWDNNTKTVTISFAGEEVSEEDLLTYSEAVNSGVRKSTAYKNAQISAEKATSQNEDFILTLGTFYIPAVQAKEGLKLADKWGEMQLNVTIEQVGFSIKTLMDNTSIKLEKKKNLEQKIDFLKYKLHIDRVKYDNGLISYSALQDTETSYISSLQELVILEKEIDNAYTELNAALEQPYLERTALEYDMKYEPIGEVDIDKKIKEDTSSDPYIWLVRQQKDLAEFNLVTYDYAFNSSQSWTLTKLDLTKAKVNVSSTENSLAKTIQSRYNQLKLLEENISSLELTLEQIQRKVGIARTQYDLGMITKSELEEAQRKVADLKLTIEELKLQHEQLKTIFEKPYLAPEYMSQS
ncbi:MAG: stalk domain-containing protein [Anaerovoracaceae bacterium]